MMESLFTRYPIFRYVPAVLLLAILFRTSAITGEHMGWLQPPFDKFIHSGVYAALGFCFCFWFKFLDSINVKFVNNIKEKFLIVFIV